MDGLQSSPGQTLQIICLELVVPRAAPVDLDFVGARVHYCNDRTEGNDHLVPANSVLVQVGDQCLA